MNEFNPTPSNSTDTTNLGIIREQTTEQVKYLLNTDDILLEVESFLKGMKYDAIQRVYYIPAGTKPLLNEQGINEVMRILKLRLSRIFLLSNFNDQQIYKICKQFAKSLLKLFYGKHMAFGIDKINIGFLVHEISDCVWGTLLRAKDAQTQQFLKDTTRTVQSHSIGSGKESKLNIFK